MPMRKYYQSKILKKISYIYFSFFFFFNFHILLYSSLLFLSETNSSLSKLVIRWIYRCQNVMFTKENTSVEEIRKYVLRHIDKIIFKAIRVYPPRTDSTRRYLVTMVSAFVRLRSPTNDTRSTTRQR